MDEIKLPVRVDRNWYTHRFEVWDKEGRCITDRASERGAHAIAAALKSFVGKSEDGE